ncbi:MAG: TlpA family protein disulfide reductase, partial [Candidatus Heimdallarchaeota archaeon]
DVLSSLDSIQSKRHSDVSTPSPLPVTQIIIAIVFISIIGLGILSLGNMALEPATITGSSIKDSLDFRIQQLDGHEVMLSDYAGEPIILDLMATWCGPCKTQIAELKKLDSSYPNVRILSISIDEDDSISILSDYKADNGMTWTVGRDLFQKAIDIYTPPGKPQQIPTLAFIDPEGILRQVYQGVVSYDSLVDWVVAG